ncbi:MAG: phosphodiester glycosidase family protein [Eubacteriales bacterium]|nr:phosphodiester glycosidase family protein [Eubacteriales bacterium]
MRNTRALCICLMMILLSGCAKEEEKAVEERTITSSSIAVEAPKETPTLQAYYDGTCEKGTALDASRIRCEATFRDGTVQTLQKIEAEFPGPITDDTDVTIHTEYGDVILSVHPSTLLRISAEYTGSLHKGEVPDVSCLVVTAYDDRGNSQSVADYTVTDFEDPVTTTRTVTVSALGFSATVQLVPVEVALIHPNLTKTAIRDEELALSSVTVIYDDGQTETISAEDLTFLTSSKKKLRLGENTYKISLYGEPYPFTVTAQATTNVEDAKKGFAEEYEKADWKYASDSIFVTVTHHETDVYTYDLAHIVINDAGQLRSELSNGSLGGERELVTDAAARLDWVIGTNASNFDYATGKPTYAGCIIKNRILMEGTRTNGMEICLMSNGVLFSPASGVDPLKLIASDVTDSWSCGDTLLVADGQAVNVGIQSQQYRYPRTAIGMVQPCEYYLLVSGESNYSRGLTYDEVRDILMEHHCEFGKCMDGGGSATMVVNDGTGPLILNETVAAPRAVSDFLYFGETLDE